MVLNIDESHLVAYALKKLVAAGLVEGADTTRSRAALTRPRPLGDEACIAYRKRAREVPRAEPRMAAPAMRDMVRRYRRVPAHDVGDLRSGRSLRHGGIERRAEGRRRCIPSAEPAANRRQFAGASSRCTRGPLLEIAVRRGGGSRSATPKEERMQYSAERRASPGALAAALLAASRTAVACGAGARTDQWRFFTYFRGERQAGAD